VADVQAEIRYRDVGKERCDQLIGKAIEVCCVEIKNEITRMLSNSRCRCKFESCAVDGKVEEGGGGRRQHLILNKE
jgi:hypothetical protein